MRKKIIFAVSVLIVVTGLLFAAHRVDFMGIMRRIHGA